MLQARLPSFIPALCGASLLGLCACASAVVRPVEHAPVVDAATTRQLLVRTGFGATPTQIDSYAKLPYDEAVNRLVDEARQQRSPLTPPPAWVDEAMTRPFDPQTATEEERKAYQQLLRDRFVELQAWWLCEIVNTPAPLAEQMTLFWHNHFTSSAQKVKVPQLMYRQNLLLREQALGNFRALLHAVARDPAMLIFLDGAQNRVGHPNENFARELLELFTLGQGPNSKNYSERDVKEAARAFTGWSVDRRSGGFEYRFLPRQHDTGAKIFLGHKGDFDGDQIIDILLDDPQVSELVVGKLWRYFVSETPDPAQVQAIAARFRKDYEIAPVVAALLETPQFRSNEARGALTKSPVDLVAGLLRSLDVPLQDGHVAALVVDRLGEPLFNPPNVKGWPGGEAWIDTSSLLARTQFLDSATRALATASPHMYASEQTATMSGTVASAAENRPSRQTNTLELDQALLNFARNVPPQRQQAVLLPIAPVDTTTIGGDAASRVRGWLLDPAYQLK